MPIYIPENDITVAAETDSQIIEVLVNGGETEIEITLDDDAKIFVQEAKSYSDSAYYYSSTAKHYSEEADAFKEQAHRYADKANTSASNADNYWKLARSFAIGVGDMRPDEATRNCEYFFRYCNEYFYRAKGASDEAKQAITTIQQLIHETTFTVNFTTGELEYESPETTFVINTATGNLEWEVLV
jgi:hypothetical protein